MNEAKRAAVVKRGADREHADLFASRPADLGSVKQTLRPPPPDSQVGGMAARNETSVLFTVDALKGAARVKTPEPEQAPASTAFMVADDEGVIDLNALASVPPKVGARSVAPLFSEPPPGAFAADVSDSGSNPVNNGGFKFGKRAYVGIAAAAVALVLFSIVLASAFKGEEPVARTANAATAPPAATTAPVVAAAPESSPVASASAPASSSDDEKSSGPAKGKGKGKGVKASASKSSGGAKASFTPTKVQSSGVTPAPATPKAADKCGCKGDFNCILRCTAKGS